MKISSLLHLADTLPFLPMSAAERRITAYHEAGHAVIHALGGNRVKAVYLQEQSRHAGVCEINQLQTGAVWWRDDLQGYSYDQAAWAEFLARSAEREVIEQVRRATVCGLLAGPCADYVLAHGPCTADSVVRLPDPVIREMDDMLHSQVLCLVGGDSPAEHLRLVALTLEALSEPDVWARVTAIAEAVLTTGRLDGEALAAHLPPPREGWPTRP